MSKIEWTDRTWNPVTGCTKVSPGCKNCYAERMHKRLQGMNQPKYSSGFNIVRIHENYFDDPYMWKSPQKIFVNSMSDLFHDDVPYIFIREIFKVMSHLDRHTYQILTKRSHNLLRYNDYLPWDYHIWMGVSVENQDYISRVADLVRTDAFVKFLSCEPLLGPLNLEPYLDQLDWIIVGAESGPGARPMKVEWVQSIRDQCVRSNTPFFFKQWGGTSKHKTGRILDNRTWDEFPDMEKIINV